MQLQNGTCPRGRARSLPEHCPASGLRLLRRRGEGPQHRPSPLWSQLPALSPAGASAREMRSRAAEANREVDPSPAAPKRVCHWPAPFQLARSLDLGPQVAGELQAGLVLCLTMPEGSGASGLGPGGCLLGLAGMGCCDGLPPSCWGDGGLCRGPKGCPSGLRLWALLGGAGRGRGQGWTGGGTSLCSLLGTPVTCLRTFVRAAPPSWNTLLQTRTASPHVGLGSSVAS